jgi:hypothetical protein
MGAQRLHTCQCGQTARASSIGSKFSVFDGFALLELGLEPIDGLRELQGPERLCLLLVLEDPYAFGLEWRTTSLWDDNFVIIETLKLFHMAHSNGWS